MIIPSDPQLCVAPLRFDDDDSHGSAFGLRKPLVLPRLADEGENVWHAETHAERRLGGFCEAAHVPHVTPHVASDQLG